MLKFRKWGDFIKVVVIDGQGGRLGQTICEKIAEEKLGCVLYAIGTNSIATAAMLKGGARYGATGENPVIVACRDADVIIGPIGIISADSMLGEITPAMAVAVGQSKALKLLIPSGHCNNQIVGVKQMSISELAEEAVEKLKNVTY